MAKVRDIGIVYFISCFLTKTRRLDFVFMWLRDFIFFLSNQLIYQPILTIISMNANIINEVWPQTSFKVNFLFENNLFCQYGFFAWNPILSKLFMNANIMKTQIIPISAAIALKIVTICLGKKRMSDIKRES